MRTTGPLGTILVGTAAAGFGALFLVPVLKAMGEESFSILNGSAPTIGAFIYLIMLPLLCISAPGVVGRGLGVLAAAGSGWACGQAALLAQEGDYRLAAGLVLLAVLVVALAVTLMRNLIARHRREVMRLTRRLHSVSEGITAHLRDRYHAVPCHRNGPNPLADVTLVDRLVNGAIGEASGASDREAFTKILLSGLRDVRDSLRGQHAETYAIACFEEQARALITDVRREGLDLPQHRPSARRVAKGQVVH